MSDTVLPSLLSESFVSQGSVADFGIFGFFKFGFELSQLSHCLFEVRLDIFVIGVRFVQSKPLSSHGCCQSRHVPSCKSVSSWSKVCDIQKSLNLNSPQHGYVWVFIRFRVASRLVKKSIHYFFNKREAIDCHVGGIPLGLPVQVLCSCNLLLHGSPCQYASNQRSRSTNHGAHELGIGAQIAADSAFCLCGPTGIRVAVCEHCHSAQCGKCQSRKGRTEESCFHSPTLPALAQVVERPA